MGQVRNYTGIAVLTTTLLVVLIGHANTWFPAIRHLELKVDKQAGKLHELHIAVISDVHLGTTIEKRHMKIIVNKINELKPDIILIPGDIIDEDIAPVLQTNVGEVLKKFNSKYGVYAVTGNHEYIGGVAKAKEYLSANKINLLNDKALLVDDSFYLAGREDITMKTFINQNRKPLEHILAEVDKSKPIILMDHQPFKLNQAEKNGIDLQLSGHTHHGQLWPFNYITNMIFELSWGYKQKGSTHFYVSSGVGGWGPPIRTVNRPEIISIELLFN
jgi:predicted MPP superfamily phosphohydrolase